MIILFKINNNNNKFSININNNNSICYNINNICKIKVLQDYVLNIKLQISTENIVLIQK
jgi:hypothetical protein